jgi:hypothetical protein
MHDQAPEKREKRDLILIAKDELITCPNDEHQFPLDQGLAEQTVRRLEHDYREQLDNLRARLNRELRAEYELALSQRAEQIRAEEAEKLRIGQIELTEKMRLNQAQIQQLEEKLVGQTRENLKLETLLRELKEQHTWALDRKAAETREAVRNEAFAQAEERFRTKFAEEQEQMRLKQEELRRQRDDALRTAEELKRRMEQGSQQTQGETLELLLEATLPHRFPSDRFSPVAKGVHGADIIHTVITADGRICGSITWETKNAQNWNRKWIEKLRQDLIDNKSEFGVLVTAALPEEIIGFGQVDGIWICGLSCWYGLALALRQQLVRLELARASAEGRKEKLDVVYRYLTGPEFRERITTVVNTFVAMQSQLAKERRALQKQWKEREKQIESVLENFSSIYGDLQGMIGSVNLPTITPLELPESEVEEE